jgi:hypothetical protein
MRLTGFIVLSALVVASVPTGCGGDGDSDAADAADASGSGGSAATGIAGNAGNGLEDNDVAPLTPVRIPNMGEEISFEARGFIGAYCALFESCCSVGGLASRCAGRVGAGALAGSFDPSAGEACLQAVRGRQSDADFCSGLERPAGIELDTSWAAVPECLAVFVPAGATAPGEACDSDSECAAGDNGAALCYTSGTCVQTSGSAGDRCFGDFQRAPLARLLAVYETAATDVFLCDNDKQLRCDSVTRVCVPIQARAVGAACAAHIDCDAASYCASAENMCAARQAVGATCTTSDECQGVCDPETLLCIDGLPSGATCRGTVGLCATETCIESRCSSLIPSVCGT